MSLIFSIFRRIDQMFSKIINMFLVCLVLALAGLLFIQVILRNFFDTGIFGAEIITRHMVLWLALLGGMLGTRGRSHIAIDIVTRALPRRARNILRIFIDTASCVVVYFLTYASYHFIIGEQLFASTLLGDIPLWWVQLIIPFGFGMICFEYAIGVILDVRRIWREDDDDYTAGQWRKYIST